MFSKLRNINFLLFLVYIGSVTSDKLSLNAQDFNQPLIITKEIINYHTDSSIFFSASTPVSYEEQNIQYDSGEDTLISACPSNESTANTAVVQNAQLVTSCTTNYTPTIQNKVSEHRNADAYSTGYLFYPFTEETGQYQYSVVPVLVDIFDIYHSSQHGLLFTSHEIHPGPKITLESWRTRKGYHTFKSGFPIPRRRENEELVQLVPFEDLIPIPWKVATLIDVNFISAPENIKAGLDELNDFLRTYVNENKTTLRVYSGVKDRSWFWKVVRQNTKGILIVVANNNPNELKNSCQNACSDFGLGTLEEKIAELLCCPLTEYVASVLQLLVIEDNSPLQYVRFSDVLNF